MTGDTTPRPTMYVRGNDHLDRLLSDPQIATDVTEANAMLSQMTRDASEAGLYSDTARATLPLSREPAACQEDA